MLTASDYKRIRAMRMEGIRPSLIADEFGCGREHVWRITRDLDAPSCKGRPRQWSPDQEANPLKRHKVQALRRSGSSMERGR